MSLEKDLHVAMEGAYRRAGREAGYWGNYFLRSVRKHGGLETARRMLRPLRGHVVPKGLQALIDAGRPDLSLEALVLDARFAPLFTAGELAEAQRRLSVSPKHAFRRRVLPEANFPETLPERDTYEEGAVSRVLVNRYERDPRARLACLRKHGTKCACCRLDFEERYGAIGKGFIHVHHKKPMATSRRAYRLNPEKDLVPVCPNCHARLHTSDPPLSVDELKAALQTGREQLSDAFLETQISRTVENSSSHGLRPYFFMVLASYRTRHSPSGHLLKPFRVPSPFDLDV